MSASILSENAADLAAAEKVRKERRIELANERLKHESTAKYLLIQNAELQPMVSIAHSLIAMNIRALEDRYS